MGLSDLFKERHWANPQCFAVNSVTTGRELLARLDIPAERVQTIFINGRAFARDAAVMKPGSRVALVPYGAPVPIAAGLIKGALA